MTRWPVKSCLCDWSQFLCPCRWRWCQFMFPFSCKLQSSWRSLIAHKPSSWRHPSSCRVSGSPSSSCQSLLFQKAVQQNEDGGQTDSLGIYLTGVFFFFFFHLPLHNFRSKFFEITQRWLCFYGSERHHWPCCSAQRQTHEQLRGEETWTDFIPCKRWSRPAGRTLQSPLGLWPRTRGMCGGGKVERRGPSRPAVSVSERSPTLSGKSLSHRIN